MTRAKNTGVYNQLDYRKRLARIAEQLWADMPLEEGERTYIADALKQIAHGADANAALGVKFGRGQKEKDARAREKMSVIMHMIAAHVEEGEEGEEQLTVEAACEHVMPIARQLFGDPDGEKYDAFYLKKCWYEYDHMRDAMRSTADADFPYSDI
jgi:hypothetical protein